MAQAATMGPPLSPRETRRSGRRSAPSASTSASKSPDSLPDSASRIKDSMGKPSSSVPSANVRNKRLKQEDTEDSVNESSSKTTIQLTGATPSQANGRNKRKGKEKEKTFLPIDAATLSKQISSALGEEVKLDGPEEEEQGITRCVCGSTGEDDPDAGEFMVQCETCKVWQHGLCMGYESEDQLHDDDYYCEQCRPEQHVELLKKLAKRARQSSTNSHQNSAAAQARHSRSHSPSYLLKQPSKRRNTMNSRDAAFDESLKEIIEATAAEAAAAQDSRSVHSNGVPNGHPGDDDAEGGVSNRRKRKRPDDDPQPKKRTRSASSASDRPIVSATYQASTNGVASGSSKVPAAAAPPPAVKSSSTRNRRGPRKPPPEPRLSVEGEEGVSLKRQANNSRGKASHAPKRLPPFHTSHFAGSGHDHGTRRNPSNGVNGTNASTSAETSRAYRNSHAYVVSQQPLFTSWNLPDYLAHLGPMLPSEVPKPLEVRGSGAGPSGTNRESVDITIERGVKVKWPSKRMSVGDMNKRVRALVEWVGREQASALDRGRRRDALEKSLAESLIDPPRTSDGEGRCDGSGQELPVVSLMRDKDFNGHPPASTRGDQADSRTATMKLMEELMEELIGFQERFGPGAKRERRLAAS